MGRGAGCEEDMRGSRRRNIRALLRSLSRREAMCYRHTETSLGMHLRRIGEGKSGAAVRQVRPDKTGTALDIGASLGKLRWNRNSDCQYCNHSYQRHAALCVKSNMAGKPACAQQATPSYSIHALRVRTHLQSLSIPTTPPFCSRVTDSAPLST
jgi:hypothetical protein